MKAFYLDTSAYVTRFTDESPLTELVTKISQSSKVNLGRDIGTTFYIVIPSLHIFIAQQMRIQLSLLHDKILNLLK
jgi:hypothetical protein